MYNFIAKNRSDYRFNFTLGNLSAVGIVQHNCSTRTRILATLDKKQNKLQCLRPHLFRYLPVPSIVSLKYCYIMQANRRACYLSFCRA